MVEKLIARDEHNATTMLSLFYNLGLVRMTDRGRSVRLVLSGFAWYCHYCCWFCLRTATFRNQNDQKDVKNSGQTKIGRCVTHSKCKKTKDCNNNVVVVFRR